MKTKIKILTVLLIAISCCFVTACNKIYYWEVAQDIENISKIEIVDIEDYKIKDIICEIDSTHYEEVVNDIQTLPARKYVGEVMASFGKSFKITFTDSTYDLISLYEPKNVLEPESGLVVGKNRRYYYQREDFDRLIEKWMNK